MSAAYAPPTPEDLVEACYEALLGRPSDPAGLAANAAALRTGGLVSTLRAFVGSPEFRQSLGLRHRPRLALIGNCWTSVLAKCLRTSPDLLVRWVADVNFAASPTFRIAVAAMLGGDADEIVTLRFGADHGTIETELMRRVAPGSVRTMTNIYLTGLHPDLTYLGTFGNRLYSPLGDYHSRIVILSYLRGDAAADCVALFNPATYARLDYFTEFERSAAELRRRDADNDIRFADRLIEMTRHERTMLSVNHPTAPTLAALAGEVAAACGVARTFSPDCFENDLLIQPVWPIYPEIREGLNLPYETDFVFEPGLRQPALPLADFVAASFARYDQQGRAAVAAAATSLGLHAGMLS